MATQVSAVRPESELTANHGVRGQPDDDAGEAGLKLLPSVSAPVSATPGRNDGLAGWFNPSDMGAGSIAATRMRDNAQ